MDGRLEGLKDNEQYIKKLLTDRFNMQNMDSEDLEVKQFMREIALAVQALDKVCCSCAYPPLFGSSPAAYLCRHWKKLNPFKAKLVCS